MAYSLSSHCASLRILICCLSFLRMRMTTTPSLLRAPTWRRWWRTLLLVGAGPTWEPLLLPGTPWARMPRTSLCLLGAPMRPGWTQTWQVQKGVVGRRECSSEGLEDQGCQAPRGHQGGHRSDWRQSLVPKTEKSPTSPPQGAFSLKDYPGGE